MNPARKLVRSLLPKSVKPRRIRAGLGKGLVANVNFELDLAFYLGRHEPLLHEHYRRLVRPGMKCFDIGTYRGWDALCLASLTGDEVVSFDGNPQMHVDAARFLEPSGFSEKISLVNAFMSDGEDDNLSIDAAAERYFAPGFIKMDIEGSEAKALRGASRVLADTRPGMIIETHGLDVENECLAILKEHGYRTRVVNRETIMSEARSLEHNRWIVAETE